MGISTDYLFARPSFIEGVARIMDIGGTLNEYNYASDGQEADAIAIWSDWAVIGQDMYKAMGIYREENSDVLL